MVIISNVEFEALATGQSPRLRSIAKHRCDQSPDGFLTLGEIAECVKICQFSGDTKSVGWLNNLAILAKSGKLHRMRTGATTWEDHVEHIHMLFQAKDIQFDLGQHVFCTDCGRYGSIADYIPDTKEYLVVLDPFQLATYQKSDLEKVAKVAQWDEDDEVPQEMGLAREELLEIALDNDVVAQGYQLLQDEIAKGGEFPDVIYNVAKWVEQNSFMPELGTNIPYDVAAEVLTEQYDNDTTLRTPGL